MRADRVGGEEPASQPLTNLVVNVHGRVAINQSINLLMSSISADCTCLNEDLMRGYWGGDFPRMQLALRTAIFNREVFVT